MLFIYGISEQFFCLPHMSHVLACMKDDISIFMAMAKRFKTSVTNSSSFVFLHGCFCSIHRCLFLQNACYMSLEETLYINRWGIFRLSCKFMTRMISKVLQAFYTICLRMEELFYLMLHQSVFLQLDTYLPILWEILTKATHYTLTLMLSELNASLLSHFG